MTIIIFGWQHTHKGIMRSRTAFGTSERIDFFQVGDQDVKKRQTVLCSLKDEKGNLWFGNSDGSLTCYCKRTLIQDIAIDHGRW